MILPYKTNIKGFFLIEVLVSVFVVTIVLIFVLASVFDTVSVTKRSLERTQAAFLLEEGAEILRFSRSLDWTNISSLTNGQVYGLSWSGSAWQIVANAQSEGNFSRFFTCDAVSRGIDDTIVSTGGVIDDNTRICTFTVVWDTSSGNREENLSFYLTNTTL